MLAAHQAGVKTIIIPLKNKVDIGSLPKGMIKDMQIHFADNLDEIVEHMLIK